ncbi:MAG: hypothetical protein OEU92_19030 [Alphaproteobacteria bacterium]|nr:hypothetical protein [Alphaproteobacteria bacterium]
MAAELDPLAWSTRSICISSDAWFAVMASFIRAKQAEPASSF